MIFEELLVSPSHDPVDQGVVVGVDLHVGCRSDVRDVVELLGPFKRRPNPVLLVAVADHLANDERIEAKGDHVFHAPSVLFVMFEKNDLPVVGKLLCDQCAEILYRLSSMSCRKRRYMWKFANK